MAPSSAPHATTRPAPAPDRQQPIIAVVERARLLRIARTSVLVATGRLVASALAQVVTLAPSIPHAAVFVTLTEQGDLRGCMGVLDPDLPIGEAVARAAILACEDDPRFPPLAPRELPDVHVEISVLATPRRINGPDEFDAGTDGVIVECGGRRALLLPEVAADHGWDAETMFDAVSCKAGLWPGAWRNPGAVLSAFRTTRFGGPVLEPAAP